MRELWRDAEQILAAAESEESDAFESHLICITQAGALRILSAPGTCSLPALAADLGAERLYRVDRGNGSVRVEGWNRHETVVLNRKRYAPAAGNFYATREILGL